MVTMKKTAPPPERAHVVAEDLALPPRIEDVLPAPGLLARLHHVGVDENARRG
jgi:hypothetical protein